MNNNSWTFFTNHGHVLFVISEDPGMRLRDVADRVGITERAAQRIVAELEGSGFLKHERVGRRNRYHLVGDVRLRHPVEAHITVDELLGVFSGQARRPSPDDSSSIATAEVAGQREGG